MADKTGFASKLMTVLTAVVSIVLVVIILQRANVIGGPPVDRAVAEVVGASGMPTLKPNPKNLKAYADVDDPTLKTSDIGPNRYQIIDIHEHAQTMAEAERLLVDRGVLKPGDTYAITCGEPMGAPGGTNMLKICRVA